MKILIVDHTGLYSTLFLMGKGIMITVGLTKMLSVSLFDYSIRGGKTGVAK